MLLNLFRVLPAAEFGQAISLAWYCRVFVVLLGAQWGSLIAVLILMFGFWMWGILNPKNYRPALHVALILPAIAIGFWGVVLPILWMSAFHALRMPSNVTTKYDGLFDEAVPLLGIQFIMCILLAAVLIWQIVCYARWRSKKSVNDFHQGHRAPRLIVHPAVQTLTGVCAVLGIVLVIYIGVMEISGSSYREFLVGQLLADAKQYAIGLLVPIGAILLLTLRYFRPGLDILLDVINHFFFRRATADDLKEDASDFDIVEVSFDEGQMYFSRRDAIHRRMKRVLEYYRNRLAGNPALTVVSHSQGTMIAIEVFNDDELDWVGQKFSQVNFVTMGSPLHHIYQQYFRHFYPPLDDPFWNNLRQRVHKWLNIFRIDDFVGTDLVFPQADAEARYSNHAVSTRGHQYYWCDRQVLAVMREHGVCRSLSTRQDSPEKHAA